MKLKESEKEYTRGFEGRKREGRNTYQILCGPGSQYKSAFHLLVYQTVYVHIEHIAPNKQVSIETRNNRLTGFLKFLVIKA